MSGFLSISHNAHSVLNNIKGQSRILEAEIKLDASRGVIILRKQEDLKHLKEQSEIAMNYLTDSINQDSENAKKFIDSTKETIDKINAEAIKSREEDAMENTEATTENSTANDLNKTADSNQESAVENSNKTNTAGTIVDIIIPLTVVTNDLPADKASKVSQNTTTKVNVLV